jgi:hypothetical protein
MRRYAALFTWALSILAFAGCVKTWINSRSDLESQITVSEIHRVDQLFDMEGTVVFEATLGFSGKEQRLQFRLTDQIVFQRISTPTSNPTKIEPKSLLATQLAAAFEVFGREALPDQRRRASLLAARLRGNSIVRQSDWAPLWFDESVSLEALTR